MALKKEIDFGQCTIAKRKKYIEDGDLRPM